MKGYDQRWLDEDHTRTVYILIKVLHSSNLLVNIKFYITLLKMAFKNHTHSVFSPYPLNCNLCYCSLTIKRKLPKNKKIFYCLSALQIDKISIYYAIFSFYSIYAHLMVLQQLENIVQLFAQDGNQIWFGNQVSKIIYHPFMPKKDFFAIGVGSSPHNIKFQE